MLEILGFVLIFAGLAGLVTVGISGLAPDLMRRHGGRARRRVVRINPRDLLPVADLTPPERRTPASLSPAVQVAPRIADELFSELFALRASVAAMSDEIRAIREHVEARGQDEALNSVRSAA